MKKLRNRKWVVPVAALALTLSIGSAAFAATGSDSTGTSAAATSTAVAGATSDSTTAGSEATTNDGKGDGGQRSDETLLTGTTAEQVKAAALAEVGSDATIDRVETDADGNAAYEAHVTKADGTHVTVYVDESFSVVSVQDGLGGGHHGGHGDPSDDDAAATSGSTGDAGSSTSTNTY